MLPRHLPLLLPLLMLFAAPLSAQQADSHKPVTLKMENADLRLALQELFKSVGQNYTLAPEVKGTVTVALTDVPFRTALDSLLRSAATDRPLTYRIEDGVYLVHMKQVDELREPVLPNESPHLLRIPLNYVSPVFALKQLAPFVESRELKVQPNTQDNSVLASGSDASLRELKQALNMVDVQPKTVLIKAEAVGVVGDLPRLGPATRARGQGPETGRIVLVSHARTVGDQPVHMRVETSGQAQSESAVTLRSGLSDVRVSARINGDDTVSLDATWQVDLQWRIPGRPNPLRLHNTYTTTATVRNGETASVTGTTMKAGARENGMDAQVLLFLTPTIQATPGPGGVRQAAYQGAVRTAIVLDFANKAGKGYDPLIRMATDAVAQQLTDSARFEVLRRAEVDKQAAELGLHPPYDQVARSRLAQSLGASVVVTEAVEFVKEQKTKAGSIESVGLTVRLEEASSGDLLAGAAVIGQARSRGSGATTEGVTKAVYTAIRQILSRQPAEGTILSTTTGPPSPSIVVNCGADRGLRAGTQMTVLRDGEKVGRVGVVAVYPSDSEARILHNTRGIRPEDRAREIATMPPYVTIGPDEHPIPVPSAQP